jgi:hypothetical protein
MPLLFLIWLLAFLLQSGLLGSIMYTVIQLTDLENDYINPHDAATNINRLVVRRCFVVAAGPGNQPHADAPTACLPPSLLAVPRVCCPGGADSAAVAERAVAVRALQRSAPRVSRAAGKPESSASGSARAALSASGRSLAVPR